MRKSYAVALVVVASLTAIVARELPAMRRYLKIRRM